MSTEKEQLKSVRTVKKRKLTILSKSILAELNAIQHGGSEVTLSILLNEYEAAVEALNNANDEFAIYMNDEEYEVEYGLVVKHKMTLKSWSDELNETLAGLSLSPSVTVGMSPSGHHAVSSPAPVVPLPKLQDIEVYSGDPLKWQTFFDSFCHTVHNSTTMSKCQKMTYLRRFLKGDAAAAIEGFSTSEANYDAAIEHLKKRFGDPEDQRQALWSKILSLEKVRNEHNVVAMRKLLDTSRSVVRSLESLDVTESSYSSMFKILLRQRIPPSLDAQWLQSSDALSASVDAMLSFFEAKVRAREQSNLLLSLSGDERPKPSNPKPSTSRQQTMGAVARSSNGCFFCDDTSHSTWKCSLPYDSKIETVKKKRACFNCLSTSHMVYKCTSSHRCKVCGRKHHTALHVEESNDKPRATSDDKPEESPPVPGSSNVVRSSSLSSRPQSPDCVILPVVSFAVEGENSTSTRCLLDTGSTSTFITEKLCRQIQPRVIRGINLELTTFGNHKKTIPTQIVECDVLPKYGRPIPLQMIVMRQLGVNEPKLSPSLPCVKEAESRGLHLCDDIEGSEVDILIGSDNYCLVTTGRRVALSCGPVALETIFGWTLQGPIQTVQSNVQASVKAVVSHVSLEEKVGAFWDIEEVPKVVVSRSDAEVEAFTKLIHYDGQRYEVPLLWNGIDRPTPNHDAAKLQFERQRKKSETGGFWSTYCDVFGDYQDFGAIEEDPDPDESGYYLPHHAVVRPDSESHKVRIVFNASAKQSGCMSLNDCLDAGPNLLPHVSSLLLNFRTGSVPLTGDIQKAFFNISVIPEDRKFLRLAWETPLRMARVPFGVNCSPFLLQAVIRFHLEKSVESGDLTIPQYHLLKGSIYMDDLILSFQSAQDRDEIVPVIESVFAKASMKVHKWKSITSDADDEKRTSRVLGVEWDRFSDELKFTPPPVDSPVTTKRQFLALLASVFDPLGLLSPITLAGKMLLQTMWSSNLTWDTELPTTLFEQVNLWIDCLSKMQAVTFRRHVPTVGASALHIFVDASEKGYGAVAYIVNNHKPYLVCSKTKVAPTKPISLPRLELQAALLGVRLLEFIKSSLVIDATLFMWSDSQIALAWIKSPDPRRWNTFVSNRVAEIQRATPVLAWNHVAGKDNPADLASRGVLNIDHLSAESMWQLGPEWLCDEDVWPPQPDLCQTQQEKKRTVVLTATVERESVDQLFPRLSSWKSIVRVTAWILRWKTRPKPLNTTLSSEEVTIAEQKLIKMVQLQSYPEEILCLQRKERVPRKSPLLLLDPFLDSEQILRVGGRLKFADLPHDSRHPVIMPYRHRLSTAIVTDIHRSLMHAGVNTMVSQLREKFWIVKCKRLCRDIRSKCVICKRYDSPMPVTVPKTAPLPADRVNLSVPFSSCGVDYAGPFTVKPNSKVYILLFVCCATRALHCELTDTLTSSEFLQAFRRFAARYGAPKQIRSDNALTFKKASLILKVEWRFICPRAPWWGGFYERFVQLLKRPLRKVLGKALVSRKELECLIAETVRVINLRPLTAVSSDVEDVNPVTPLSLLGQTYSQSDEPCELNAAEMTKRQKYMHRLSSTFRRRWSKEYIVSLNRLFNASNSRDVFREGDVVLIANEKPRSSWPIAKIIQVIPGSDKSVRMCKLLCNHQVLYRPVQKLLPLEVHAGSDSHPPNPIVDLQPDVPVIDSEDVQRTKSGRRVKPRDVLDL